MSEIADEFKVVVVEAIKALCLKFPQVRCLPACLPACLRAWQQSICCRGLRLMHQHLARCEHVLGHCCCKAVHSGGCY
jgi:hypothetical protein